MFENPGPDSLVLSVTNAQICTQPTGGNSTCKGLAPRYLAQSQHAGPLNQLSVLENAPLTWCSEAWQMTLPEMQFNPGHLEAREMTFQT